MDSSTFASVMLPADSPLDSWKEIAEYLRRSPHTVRRWERQEGLPVRRHMHGKQGSVYAFRADIDEWLKWRSAAGTAVQTRPGHTLLSDSQPPSDREQKGRRSPPVMLAVLPLQNLSGDPREAKFADGVTEELISEIRHSNPAMLGVIASTSVMRYKQSPKGIGEIGQELGVDYVLEGGIRHYGRRIRMTARLIKTHDQAHVWEDAYEIQLPAMFSMQQILARRFATSLSAEFKLTAGPVLPPPIPHGELAHSACVKEKPHALPTDTEFRKKIEELSLAIDREPKSALAYTELAFTYFRRLFSDQPPFVNLIRIKELAFRALKLDSGVARAHAMMGAVHLFSTRNWGKAGATSGRATRLNPADPWAWIIRAAYHVSLGKPDKARKDLGQVGRLNPQSAELNLWSAGLAYFARCYDLAIARAQEILRLDPCLAAAHSVLGSCYVQLGEYARAIIHCQKAADFGGGTLWQTATLSSTYALAGGRDAAERLLQDLVATEEQHYIRYAFLAIASAALGNNEQTLDWLEKAFEQRDPLLVFLKADRRFELLFGHPRFRKLVRRLGLPQ
jgi:TolB-like protein/Flp pilus assembly protein TadD